MLVSLSEREHELLGLSCIEVLGMNQLNIFGHHLSLIRLEAAVARELQCSAVFRDRSHDVVGCANRDLGFDFQRDAHR